MDVKSVWRAAAAEMELSMSPVTYRGWIKTAELIKLESAGGVQIATIKVPSTYHQQTLEQRYVGQLTRAIERASGQKAEIVFEIKPEGETKMGAIPLFEQGREEPKKNNLNPRLTFESFVVGTSNNFAYAAAEGAAKSPGTRYNPLFIYGGVGLGKTHLMHAVGHSISQAHPDWEVLYLSAETFGSDLIASLRAKRTDTFKKKYRAPHVLLVDDVQFIAGKEYIQEEFFHTFNQLYLSQKQIVLTSDRPPQEIAKLEERLSSRFMGGIMVDVQTPDYETRVAILTQKCEALGVKIESESLSILAERPVANIRQLEGSLTTLLAKAHTGEGVITSQLVRELLGTQKEQRTERVRPSAVVAKTAQYFEYKTAELLGASRKAPLAMARHVAMYLLYVELSLPYERIGELFGGRDHTTAMHAVEKITELVKTDLKTAKIVADIKQGL